MADEFDHPNLTDPDAWPLSVEDDEQDAPFIVEEPGFSMFGDPLPSSQPPTGAVAEEDPMDLMLAELLMDVDIDPLADGEEPALAFEDMAPAIHEDLFALPLEAAAAATAEPEVAESPAEIFLQYTALQATAPQATAPQATAAVPVDSSPAADLAPATDFAAADFAITDFAATDFAHTDFDLPDLQIPEPPFFAEPGTTDEDLMGAAAAAAAFEEFGPAPEPQFLQPSELEEVQAGSLDRLIEQMDREVRATPLEVVPAKREVEGKTEKYVVFSLSGIRYALPIQNVLEMEKVPGITIVPNLPEFVRGVTNLRGEIIAVLDLRVLFGLDQPDLLDRRRILVVRGGHDPITTAIIVDEVRGIASLVTDRLTKPLVEQGRIDSLLRGVFEQDEHSLHVLDVDKLFLAPELRQFEAN